MKWVLHKLFQEISNQKQNMFFGWLVNVGMQGKN